MQMNKNSLPVTVMMPACGDDLMLQGRLSKQSEFLERWFRD